MKPEDVQIYGFANAVADFNDDALLDTALFVIFTYGMMFYSHFHYAFKNTNNMDVEESKR